MKAIFVRFCIFIAKVGMIVLCSGGKCSMPSSRTQIVGKTHIKMICWIRSLWNSRYFSVLFCHNSAPWGSYEVLLGQNYSSKRPRPPYTYQPYRGGHAVFAMCCILHSLSMCTCANVHAVFAMFCILNSLSIAPARKQMDRQTHNRRTQTENMGYIRNCQHNVLQGFMQQSGPSIQALDLSFGIRNVYIKLESMNNNFHLRVIFFKCLIF